MNNIVIVDDNKTQLILLELLLNQIGIEPVKFSDPLKAYEYIKSHKTDILISDFNMPQVNGIELIRAVKKLSPTIKTAIVSAMRDDDESLKSQCYSLNTPLLLKPFDSSAFRELMSRFIKFEKTSVKCIKKNGVTCLLRDKVASKHSMMCCLDDIIEEKEVIQSTVDAIEDFFPSSTMLRNVATKLSFVANTMNTTNDKELEELLLVVKQLTFILHEYSQQILNDGDITTLVSSHLSVISEWFKSTFLQESTFYQTLNYNDSIKADLQTIEMALGISEIDFDEYGDLDDLFF